MGLEHFHHRWRHGPSPDLNQMGQTALDLSGRDAGGDGWRMTSNGIDGPGWSVSDPTLGYGGGAPATGRTC